jgi:hypothetical protein
MHPFYQAFPMKSVLAGRLHVAQAHLYLLNHLVVIDIIEIDVLWFKL